MINLLRHLFLPREANNYRSGFLHHKILLSFILFFVSAGILTYAIRTNFPSVLGLSADISTQQLLILTNQQRQNNNLSALTDNAELDQAATNKAADMFSKDYWAHNAPDGTTPWVFIKGAGYNYVYAGENLARGFSSASDVVTAWMNSPEHRQNVLSPNYQNVGFAVATGKLSGEDTVLVVEMLGSTNLGAPVASENNSPPAVAAGSPTATNAKPANVPVVTPAQIPVVQVNNPNLLGVSIIKPLIDSHSLVSLSAGAILALFIFVLILDMVIIERKKVVRFVGHNLDHLFFLGAMFAIVIILLRGAII
ncbi:MAG TPA: CAP domain-containing protein [Patescibacteria group bacterium]|jgi:hypothetical protein|nr:CAP domain-containing protein [Patescibacteria group bacterium]